MFFTAEAELHFRHTDVRKVIGAELGTLAESTHSLGTGIFGTKLEIQG
jgi:hypothetical protein